MFTQVYFHKTRRAYDYHVIEVLKSFLDSEGLPPPERIEEFMKLDDFVVWKFISENSTLDANCAAILNRHHIRELHYTSETPTKKEEDEVKEIEERLDDEGIWYYEDGAEKLWYRLHENGEENGEVMVKDEKKKPTPLSQYSNIVKNMGEMKQIRIYVKPEERERAEDIVREVMK